MEFRIVKYVDFKIAESFTKYCY